MRTGSDPGCFSKVGSGSGRTLYRIKLGQKILQEKFDSLRILNLEIYIYKIPVMANT